MSPDQLREVQNILELSVPKFAARLDCSQSLLDKIYSGKGRNKRNITPAMRLMVIDILEKEIKSWEGDKSEILCLHKRIKSGTV